MHFLILYGIAAGFILYRMIRELANLHQVSTLRKSSLLPFIHTANEDDTFYSEELSGGFIIQTEPINLMEISNSKEMLAELSANCEAPNPLFPYLESCLNSSDEKLVNTIEDKIPIYHMDNMKEQLSLQQIEIAILAVPADAAQAVADDLVDVGVKGILNFTPVRISVPDEVLVQNVDLANELQTLIYFLNQFGNK